MRQLKLNSLLALVKVSEIVALVIFGGFFALIVILAILEIGIGFVLFLGLFLLAALGAVSVHEHYFGSP